MVHLTKALKPLSILTALCLTKGFTIHQCSIKVFTNETSASINIPVTSVILYACTENNFIFGHIQLYNEMWLLNVAVNPSVRSSRQSLCSAQAPDPDLESVV